MRFWLKILVAVLLLILLLLLGGALFVAQIDPNDYRGTLSDLVKSATGRTLRIGGDLRFKLLPHPSFEANDVVFANAEWASQPDMVHIQRLRAEILLAPLLEGNVVVQRFVAIDPRVLLETGADGRSNWQFGAREPGRAAHARKRPKSLTGGMNVVVKAVRIDNAVLDYVDDKRGTRTQVAVDTLTLGARHAGGPLRLELRGRYQDLAIEVTGSIGPVAAMLRNEPLPVDLQASVDEATFTLKGAVGKPLDADELNLEFVSSSPSTSAITRAIGLDVEELGPVDVSTAVSGGAGSLNLDPFSLSARPWNTEARLEGTVTGFAWQRLSSSDAGAIPAEPMALAVDGAFGDARVHVEGDVGNLVTARDVRLAVRAQAPATRALTTLAGIAAEEFGPVDLSVVILGDDGRYGLDHIALTARPLDTLVEVRGSVRDVALGAQAKGAQPARVDLEGTFGDKTRFDVAGEVGKPLEAEDVRLKISAAAESTRPLTKLAGVDVEEFGPVNAAATVVRKGGRIDLTGIDVKANPREAKLSVTGAVTDATRHPRPDLQVAVSAHSLRGLGKMLPAAGPVEASAKVVPSGDVIEIRDLVAKVGKSDLSGSANFDIGGKRPSASAKLHSGVLDLAELAPASGEAAGGKVAKSSAGGKDAKPSAGGKDAKPSAGGKDAKPSAGGKDAKPSAGGKDAKPSAGGKDAKPTAGGRVFSDRKLPFDTLKKADADIELVVDRLITRKLALESVDVSAKLDDGNLTLKPAAHVAGGKFGGTIVIDSRTRPAKLDANIDAAKVSIGKLREEISGLEMSKGLASDLEMKLAGRGDSVRAIMAGLDGNFALQIGEGRLKNDLLNKVGADIFAQLLGVLVPSDQTKGTTPVDCAVIRFDIQGGKAVADRTVVVKTDKVLLTGSGLIDLQSETVDFGAVLAARKGIRIGAGTLSSLVRVQGTLAEPRLGTDLTGMAKTGVKIGAAVFTAGLSLLAESLLSRATEDEHPCQTAMERSIDMEPSEIKRLFMLQ